MARFVRVSLVVTWFVVALATPARSQTLLDPDLQVQPLFDCCPSGVAIEARFLDRDDLLVLFKDNGYVRRLLNGVFLPQPVLDVDVHSYSSRGLVGIELDPDFVNNRHVYLFYTENASGDTNSLSVQPLGNRVYRYTWNGSELVDPVLILDVTAEQDSGFSHTSGFLRFGPDDKLYVSIGDLDHRGHLQNISDGPLPDDTSVIFRIETNGMAPPDNPFYEFGYPMNRYFAYGLRNPYGLAFDPLTGDLWETENGPDEYDEINRITPGFNGGWHRWSGPEARSIRDQSWLVAMPGSTYSDPQFSWKVPVCVTAIAFVDSPRLGCDNRHVALVAACNCGSLYRFELDASRTGFSFASSELQDLVADNDGDLCQVEQSEILFGSGFGAVTDIRSGPDGAIYVTRLGQTVYRISRSPDALTDADGDEVDVSCDCAPADSTAYTQPSEIPRLRVSAVGSTTLGWDAQAASAGSGTNYTVIGGDLSILRTQQGYASACRLGTDLASARLEDPRPDPAPGSAWYYLVEAKNGCGSGTFGRGSAVPDPRAALVPASVPICQ